MAKATDLAQRQFESYQDTGHQKSITLTLSGTPGEITAVTLPNDAAGIKVYPPSNDVVFAVDQTPVPEESSSSAAIAPSDFGVGGYAIGGLIETRLLHSGKNRVLNLLSQSASTIVKVETF